MAHFLAGFFLIAGETLAALLLLAGLLHLIPRLGLLKRPVADFITRAPGLDVVVAYFTVVPLIYGPIVAGWAGFFGAIAGQVASVLAWQFLHEAANREAIKGPRIVAVLNRLVGKWRNHAALWVTAIVTPMFFIVRLAEILLYPPLTWLVGFPKYDSGDWVNVSRQKFSGLVGHDLIWCLYCDWMTGIWSLGSEMLRNVESFWCPIRFDSAKKCANCETDFPDVDHGWVPASATMGQVTQTLEEKYGATKPGERAWYGHPVRVTARGKAVETVRIR